MPFWVRGWRDDDVAPIVDTLRRLSLDGTIRMVPQIAQHADLRLVPDAARRSGGTATARSPTSVIDHIARELEVGRWMMRAALYGDEPVVDHRFAKVKAAFEAIPGVEVWGTKTTPDEAAGMPHPAERIQGGVPDLDDELHDRLVRRRGGRRARRLLAGRADDRARTRWRVRDLMRGLIEGKANLDYLGAMLAINARSFIHVTMVMFDTANEPQVRGAYDTCKLLVREAAKHGYGEYRAHLDFMDLARRAVSASATTPSAASTRRSRTRSTPTASSRPASRGSGRRRCATGAGCAMRERRGGRPHPAAPTGVRRLHAPSRGRCMHRPPRRPIV